MLGRHIYQLNARTCMQKCSWQGTNQTLDGVLSASYRISKTFIQLWCISINVIPWKAMNASKTRGLQSASQSQWRQLLKGSSGFLLSFERIALRIQHFALISKQGRKGDFCFSFGTKRCNTRNTLLIWPWIVVRAGLVFVCALFLLAVVDRPDLAVYVYWQLELRHSKNTTNQHTPCVISQRRPISSQSFGHWGNRKPFEGGKKKNWEVKFKRRSLWWEREFINIKR